jgi:4'-phosphopantetheinyl transferase
MQIKELYIEQLSAKARVFLIEFASHLKSENLLVYIMSKYYHIDIDINQICYGKYGKPFFRKGIYYFNISNSGSMTTIVVSTVPVGIDIQKIKKKDFLYELFDERELKITSNILDKTEGCIFLWTVKEAYTKLLGVGVNKPFSEILVETVQPISVFDQQICSKVEVDFFWEIINKNYVMTICLKREEAFEEINRL